MRQAVSTTRESLPGVIPDREWIAAYLRQAIAEFHFNAKTPRLLQRLAGEYPDLFRAAAAKELDSDVDSPAHRFLAGLLVRQESLIEWLVNPARGSCENAVSLFRRLLAVDP